MNLALPDHKEYRDLIKDRPAVDDVTLTEYSSSWQSGKGYIRSKWRGHIADIVSI